MSRRGWALAIGIPVAAVLAYLLTSVGVVALWSVAFDEPDRPHAVVVNDTPRPVRIVQVNVRTGAEMFVSGTIPPHGGSQQVGLPLPQKDRCTSVVAYYARVGASDGGPRRVLCRDETWHLTKADLPLQGA